MSAEGLRSRWFELRAQLHAGWRWWLGEILALLPDGVRNALAANDPVIAIDLQDDAVIVRRFADGAQFDIADLPRAQFDAAHLRGALASALAKPWFLRDAF